MNLTQEQILMLIGKMQVQIEALNLMVTKLMKEKEDAGKEQG